MAQTSQGAWWNGLPIRLRGEAPNDADEEELEALLGDVRALLPNVKFDSARLVGHLAKFASTPRPDRATFAALHLRDVALAFAIMEGEATALAIFECDYEKDLAISAVARGESAADLAAWKTELVDPRQPHGLIAYSGRGSLHAWLRVAQMRRKKVSVAAVPMREMREPEDVRALDAAHAALERALQELTREDAAAFRDRDEKNRAHTSAIEQAVLLRTRRYLFAKGVERAKGEEALRHVWATRNDLLAKITAGKST